MLKLSAMGMFWIPNCPCWSSRIASFLHEAHPSQVLQAQSVALWVFAGILSLILDSNSAGDRNLKFHLFLSLAMTKVMPSKSQAKLLQNKMQSTYFLEHKVHITWMNIIRTGKNFVSTGDYFPISNSHCNQNKPESVKTMRYCKTQSKLYTPSTEIVPPSL